MTPKKKPAKIVRIVYERVKATRTADAEHMVAMCQVMAFSTAHELNKNGCPAVVVEGYYLSYFVDRIHYDLLKPTKHYWTVCDGKIYDLALEQFNEENIFDGSANQDRYIATKKIIPDTPAMRRLAESLYQRGYGVYMDAATDHGIR